MPTTLASQRHRVADLAEAIELCYTKGWTDGLPVVPPTLERVEAMLAASPDLLFVSFERDFQGIARTAIARRR